jgi:heterodisulfide reductase subunit A
MAKDEVGAVLVVGGGIGGIQASLDLADSGFKVYLLDNTPSIGGVMAQLDKTFPTLDCAICILSPKMVEAGRHLNIEVITYSDLLSVDGELGNFKVKIKKRARSVDESLCTGCGTCWSKCPVKKIPSEFDVGLGTRAAIYVPFLQAVPNIPVIDRDNCVYFEKEKCKVCEKFCQARAIKFDQADEVIGLDVGAIILAPGFDEFAAELKGEYGYGRFGNVITSIGFERILSASGPFQGHLQRPSDGREPKTIAFIQCVGSRDIKDAFDYCSSVCCTYAIKEAILAKEHSEKISTTIFYMDMRTYGKGFEEFYNRAKDEYGVRFMRARISCAEEDPQTKNLRISYESDEGKFLQEDFDLVVLSVGLAPLISAKELSKTLGIELNEYAFCKTSLFEPLETSRSGVFVCGAFQGPKDIPETVAQASGAVSKVSELLSQARGTLVKRKVYPPEIPVGGQEPRVGVFICHCGVNIGGYVDVPLVTEYAKTLPSVVYAENNLYTCSPDTQERIKSAIKGHNLNRVVVASCTPRTHEPMFRETLREAGLSKYLFEMANIRDQCSWVHMHEPEAATQKAKDLVRMAVARACLIQPLEEMQVEVIRRGLVIGGGLAGMTAALGLAEQGFEVYLIEKEEELGGNLRKLYYTLDNNNPQEYLKTLVKKIESNPLIHTFTEAEIKEISGFVGNFKTKMKINGGQMELEHGVIIVATGGQEYKPKEYLYGQDERVITQQEFEGRLANNQLPITNYQTIVMIQCVGSRCEERPYCSRVCCSEAIKNALKIKEINPKANIYILYKDVRTYGFKEKYYTKAREEGAAFVRYDDENKPQVTLEGDKIKVSCIDPILTERLVLSPDLLVLSTAIVPHENEDLAKMLKVPLTADGFFLEAHVKLRPVDFATDGIFLCGLAHSPKLVDETIAQASGAVAKASIPLSQGYVSVEPIISHVDEEKCVGCGLCESLCAFGAIEVVTKEGRRVAQTIAASCKGCGVCGASCPQEAITMRHFTNEQIISQVRALAEVA